MPQVRVLGVLGGLLLAACSDRASSPPEPPKDAPSSPKPLAPTPPMRVPELPPTAERDADGNRIDDLLDEHLRSAGGDPQLLRAQVRLQVVLNAPLEQADLDDFVAAGGKVRYVFRELRYGFTGVAPLERVKSMGAQLGARLHVIAAPSVIVPFMDEATRTGRIRGVWAPGFAGNISGYSGNRNITIAVIDTGVDESHTDFDDRIVSWKDYSGDPAGPHRDVEGHGTHVASIAVGTGAAFGASTATLPFTQSGTLSGVAPNNYLQGPVHTPAYLGGVAALTASASAKFLGGASATLHTLWALDPNGGVTAFGSKSGGSPLTLTNQDGGTSGMIYMGGLVQPPGLGVTNFAVANSIASYPGVGDGFNAFRGVAPGCKYLAAKVFPDVGSGSSEDIEAAVDEVAANRLVSGVKVMNLSLGITGGGTDENLRTTVNSAVNAGIVVVVAAGNDGPSTKLGDPARASKVITVGATNDVNELTTYSSVGLAGSAGDDDTKPDVLGPGGSSYRSAIMAADSNTSDGQLSSFADLVPNDYAPLQGTSMAAPFVSGSIALMIDAWQQSGTAWTFSGSAQPLFLKMLLSASATELNRAREQGAANSPTLGRAAAAKDTAEGYGIINPDAAIEALVQTFTSPLTGSVSGSARSEWERRAWGRKLSLVNGATVILNLDVPAAADFDLYLYSGSPDGKGNPVLRASSTNVGSGADETISYASTATETAYMFVKRVSGNGAFSCTGSAVSHCGDGDLDTGELCDPAMAGSTTCCTATCSIITNGTSCDDGNACTKTDSCQAGACSGGNPIKCAVLDQCHGVGICDTQSGACSNPERTDGTSCDDKNKCTHADTCQAGACTGGSPVSCTASDQCHDAGTCDAASGACSNPPKTDNTSCDDNNQCTKTDTCQSGSCTGASPVVCTALDQCHDAGTCDTSTGLCPNPKKTDGTSCSDGDKCTRSDTCQAGTCQGASPIVCAALDQCHDAGSCEGATGTCSNPAKSDGSACSDGNFCTQLDTCVSGRCAPGAAVACTATDQCHQAGACDPGTGVCSNPPAADGKVCNDGNNCTLLDVCATGICAPTVAQECAAPDECHAAGVCQPSDGACVYAAKPDGAACGVEGSCRGGSCVEPNSGTGGQSGVGGDANEAGASGIAGTGGSGGTSGGGSAGTSNGGGAAGAVGGSVGVAASAGDTAVGASEPGPASSAGEPGAEPTAGSAPLNTDTTSHQSSGCGCTLPGTPAPNRYGVPVLAAAALLLQRRWRRAG